MTRIIDLADLVYASGPLCDLFCQLQSYNGHYCCPAQYMGDTERELLCGLWSELEQLNNNNNTETTTTDFPLAPVDCIYEGNPTSAGPLCSLWCELQTYRGSQCIECPEIYKTDPERVIICSLWSELEMINYDIVSAGSITTIVPEQNITCAYSDHLMSADLLCEVWCKIQATKGLNCVFCPDIYKSDPESEQLCHLWASLVELEAGGEGPGDVTSLVTCPHHGHLTSSWPLCDLWCDVSAYNGTGCLQPCPDIYTMDTEMGILCRPVLSLIVKFNQLLSTKYIQFWKMG